MVPDIAFHIQTLPKGGLPSAIRRAIRHDRGIADGFEHKRYGTRLGDALKGFCSHAISPASEIEVHSTISSLPTTDPVAWIAAALDEVTIPGIGVHRGGCGRSWIDPSTVDSIFALEVVDDSIGE